MKVNLNIEEDDMFRQHVKGLIEGQVRAVLREQLGGIVAGEIAKLRLLQPGSPTLGEHVAKEVAKCTQGLVSRQGVQQAIDKAVKDHLAETVFPSIKDMKVDIANRVAAAIKA